MTGAERIAAERRRQTDQEGWTQKHDSTHTTGGLAIAAACYALPSKARDLSVLGLSLREALWPWANRWWKPTPDDRIRELEKAGALIAAEIDRLLWEAEQ